MDNFKIVALALLALLFAIPARAGVVVKGKLTEYVIRNCVNDDTMRDDGTPACSALYDFDPGCGFGPGGGGRWSIISRSGEDLSVRIRLSGLNAGCEGETLRPYGSLDAVAVACSGVPCATSFPVDHTTCVVTNGACAIDAPIPGTAGVSLSGLTYFEVRRGLANGDWRTFVPGVRQ